MLNIVIEIRYFFKIDPTCSKVNRFYERSLLSVRVILHVEQFLTHFNRIIKRIRRCFTRGILSIIRLFSNRSQSITFQSVYSSRFFEPFAHKQKTYQRRLPTTQLLHLSCYSGRSTFLNPTSLSTRIVYSYFQLPDR